MLFEKIGTRRFTSRDVNDLFTGGSEIWITTHTPEKGLICSLNHSLVCSRSKKAWRKKKVAARRLKEKKTETHFESCLRTSSCRQLKIGVRKIRFTKKAQKLCWVVPDILVDRTIGRKKSIILKAGSESMEWRLKGFVSLGCTRHFRFPETKKRHRKEDRKAHTQFEEKHGKKSEAKTIYAQRSIVTRNKIYVEGFVETDLRRRVWSKPDYVEKNYIRKNMK